MKTTNKITKDIITDAINLFFRNKGQRLTNLNKANKNRLYEIINKHNINLDEMINELEIIKELKKVEIQKKEEEEVKKKKQIENERKIKEGIILMKWNSIKHEDKDKIVNILYDEYVKETKRVNQDIKKYTDKMENIFKQEGNNVIRIDEYNISVMGININYGCSDDNIENREVYCDYIKTDEYIKGVLCTEIGYYKKHNELINKYYERQMINEGFIKDSDGDFYKTIIVKKRR